MFQPTLNRIIAIASVVSVVGCGETEDDTGTGEARMGIVGEDDLGNVYRLRDATFDFNRGNTLAASISTEDYAPSLPSLPVELGLGVYSVFLQGGWTLEQWDPFTDTVMPVPATLVSTNPTPLVEIYEGEVVDVNFVFSVDGQTVRTGAGRIDIDVDVVRPRRVFVTRDAYQGDLGGVEGADEICRSTAMRAGLGSNYVAWISDSTSNAADRFTTFDAPYQRVDGQTISSSFAALAVAPLFVAIGLDELGDPVPFDAIVATSTDSEGNYAPSGASACADWTSVAGTTAIGNPINTSSWTQSGAAFCDREFRLYCFEQ